MASSSSQSSAVRSSRVALDVVVEEIPDLTGEVATWYINDAAKKNKIVVMEITDDSEDSKRTHEMLKEAAVDLGSILIFSIKFSELGGLEYRFRKNLPGVMFIRGKWILRWSHAQIVANEMCVKDLVDLTNNLDF